ncbi:hypothetical protein [Campylobacter gastrosuis]|uniref:Uncharacterized protein n=1 Tax=Campylobacter gastrosuis TaxID=2974576 RepID=A0ABT7HR86_9BACT|nr:hypothetical protein [Campylobacter gastrosuis]MDL0089237.1 hypothetical protein [Campylobacter gastrosuis]
MQNGFDEFSLEVADSIIKNCYWGNTNYTAKYLLENIDNRDFARKIFSAILENSKNLTYDLSILKDEYVVLFLKEWQNKSFNFNQEKMRLRVDALINAYIDSTYELRDKKWS